MSRELQQAAPRQGFAAGLCDALPAGCLRGVWVAGSPPAQDLAEIDGHRPAGQAVSRR